MLCRRATRNGSSIASIRKQSSWFPEPSARLSWKRMSLSWNELFAVLGVVSGSLTATVHAEPSDVELGRRLLVRLRRLAGRIVWNGWPTGVAVTWSMHHGEPWPATTDPLHTSVGVTSMRRFLVPVVYQNTPQELLPDLLRDSDLASIPHRSPG